MKLTVPLHLPVHILKQKKTKAIKTDENKDEPELQRLPVKQELSQSSSFLAKSILQPGSFVQIIGVKGNSSYNGFIGIVLDTLLINEENQENGKPNREIPRYQIRLIEGYPDKMLYVKTENVVRSTRDSSEWVLPQKDLTILEIIRSPIHASRIGNVHACHTFAANLWAEVTSYRWSHPPPAAALILHDRYVSIGMSNVKETILSSKGHKIYWLGLDSVCHHIILERNKNGRWRVYQTCIKEGSLGYMSKGYTAMDWCSQGSFMKENAAHRRWGGGITVGNKQIESLLDNIHKYQELTAHILRWEFMDQVPNLKDSLKKHLKIGPNADVPVNLRRKIVGEAKKVREYGNELLKHNASVIGLGAGRGEPSPGVNEITLDIGDGLYSLKISVESYVRSQELYTKLTGEKMNPGNLLRMLQTGLWWEFLVNPDGSYNGFYFRRANLS